MRRLSLSTERARECNALNRFALCKLIRFYSKDFNKLEQMFTLIFNKRQHKELKAFRSQGSCTYII